MKYIFYTLLALIVIGLLAGGFHLYRVSQKNKKEMAQYSGPAEKLNQSLGKVLIIYYSLSGHTKDIAERIKSTTGGDIYEIKTAQEITSTPLMYTKIKQQLKNKDYPELSGNIPDFSQYDMIFIGSPVWWYTVSTPVLSFLKQTDFKGKKVVPFSTQGSNYGNFFSDFAENAQNAKLLKSASFNNLPDKYTPQIDNKITRWLNSL